jgi:sugar phosphate isomerase/epimerase
MRHAISNIAWERHDDPKVLFVLRELGIEGIEVAPTKIWPGWGGATPKAAARYRRFLLDEGFEIPALQALLFGRNDLALFGDPVAQDKLVDHMRSVADLAACLGAQTLVFGSPKLRDPGDLDPEEAFDMAVHLFRRMAAICGSRGVVIGIEPNPAEYGCRFATGTLDVLSLAKAVGDPALRVHIDCGQMAMTGEDPGDVVPEVLAYVSHVHASEPWLSPLDNPKAPHEALARALRNGGYQGWVSIEMRQKDSDIIGGISNAARLLKRVYV